MYKFLGSLLDAATLVGEVKDIELHEANEYWPGRIDLEGVTPEGDKFEIQLKVGVPLGKNS